MFNLLDVVNNNGQAMLLTQAMNLFQMESDEIVENAVQEETKYRTGTAIYSKKLYNGPNFSIELDWQNNLRLDRFNKNPVLLADHVNSVYDVIGRVPEIKKTRKGCLLYTSPSPRDS